jgi:hypothetical protein
MATINSPLGSKTFQSGMREFVVNEEDGFDDPQQYQQPIQPSFQQAPQRQPHQKYFQQRASMNGPQEQEVSQGARKRIEMLCGMTQLTKDVQIGDAVFTLTSLKTKDNRNALTAAIKFDGTVEFSFELRKQLLARSIVAVSEVEISMFLGTNDFQAKLDFLDELDYAVSERLYSEFVTLDKEIKEKYSIKTEQDVKEVSEDLKK